MHSRIKYSMRWSMLELRGLVEDEDTRVYFQRAKKHLGLHPFHLNDLNRALQEILNSSVNIYDNELQGLVLAYKNPKLLSPLGAILHDSHFVHVDIIGDFYVFKPEIGCTLKGIINKKAANHVGVLVHKAFNVSIPKEDENEEWLGDCVYVGQQVKFTVTHLDFKGKLPFVRGKLLADGITVENRDEQVSSLNAEEEEEKLSKWNNSLTNNQGLERSRKQHNVSIQHGTVDSSGDEVNDADNKLKVFKKNEAGSAKLGSEPPKKRSKKSDVIDSSDDEVSESDNKLKVSKKNGAASAKLGSESPKKRSKKSKVVGSSDDEVDESDNKLKVFKKNEAASAKRGSESPKKRSKKSKVIDNSDDEVDDSDNKLRVFEKNETASTKLGSESTKKRSKKSNVMDSSDDEVDDSDNKLKVFKKTETKSAKHASESPKKRSKKSNVIDSSDGELSDSDNKLKVSRAKEAKSRKLDSESSKKRSKKSDSNDKSNDDLSDSDNKAKVFRAKEEKSRKTKKAASTSRSDDESDADDPEERASTSISTEEREESSNKRQRKKLRQEIDEKPKISPRKASKEQRANGESHSISDEILPKTETPAAPRKRSHNSSSATSPETEEPSESKTGLIKSLKVEKSSKDKKAENSPKSDSRINGLRHDSDDDHDDSAVSAKKRVKKNRIIDSEGEEASEIDTKPDIPVKKKKKKSKIKIDEEETANSHGVDELNAHASGDSSFEFVKPDLDALVSSAKIKRKRRKDTGANGEEETGSSKIDRADDNSDEYDFFRDVRIKTEPDPSDAEDAVSRSIKRRKKHAKTEVESSDESSFGNRRIKIEPNASDVEDAMPSKKKSKRRRTSEGESFANIKIKVEPNASDVEDSINPKRRFKSEPHDPKLTVDQHSDKV